MFVHPPCPRMLFAFPNLSVDIFNNDGGEMTSTIEGYQIVNILRASIVTGKSRMLH